MGLCQPSVSSVSTAAKALSPEHRAHGASWPYCGVQLDWQGPGPGAWGLENPTGGCHPVSQAFISCSEHNWAVITLRPQMGCRCDYVLLATPCLRLLTACCPWCPSPAAPPQTWGNSLLHNPWTAFSLLSVQWPRTRHRQIKLVLSCKLQLAPIPARKELRLPSKIAFSQVSRARGTVHRREVCRQISVGSGLGQVVRAF